MNLKDISTSIHYLLNRCWRHIPYTITRSAFLQMHKRQWICHI